MSSDESASTNISTVSSRNENKPNTTPHKPEKWEIDLIGNFLLDLYHRSIITLKDEWCVKKSEVRAKFVQFSTAEQRQSLKNLNGTNNIGTLLYRCGFLLNTPRGSPTYKIKSKSVFEFRNNKLLELDNSKINNDGPEQTTTTNDKNLNKLLTTFEEEIDETEPKKPLECQGSTMQRRVKDFCPTNMSCFICQKNFITMESFEDHVQIHGDDTDFEFSTYLDHFISPLFTFTYRLCKNSHNFCFEFDTSLENLIIEKIIIVQSRSFFYVHNMRVPYKFPENGVDRFFVDSHLFTIHLEQPIVIIAHLEGSEETRFIEEHHFMRSEEFPKVRFSINPNRLPNKKLFKPKFQLADYFPPKEIRNALKEEFYHESLMSTSNEFRDYIRNEKKLQPQTIGASMNILLQIEDMDTIQQYFNLKRKGIKVRSYGDEYNFQLKPEQRIFLENILSAYDEVILTTRSTILTNTKEVMKLMLQNTSDINRMDDTFVGQIQAVNTGRISFKCGKKFDLNDSYTVIFRPSRMNFRYQYRALELLPINMEFLKKFLFPTKIIPRPLPTTSINLYNDTINEEQLQAVRNIAEGPRNDATYIIFGPPGTGKTVTLVESTLQVLRKPDTKILITASSNSACDEVALRLLKYLPQLDIKRSIVRIYARSCEVRSDTLDDELLANSNLYCGQFYPDIDILHEYRVVICTLSVVAKLSTGKFGREGICGGVYTHLFIDEVAASMEAEALMGITTILTAKSCLIIAGDNKQLGPVLKSKRAKELGLGASLMDRLLTRDCYRVDVDTGDYDRTIQTRLIRNYRSHPAIVNLYSGLYYNHSLEACAKRDDVSLVEAWHKSRNKQYPIIFHAIYEPSSSDSQSHSLYNLTELNVVMDYVKDFMYFGVNGEPVKESDIGIISPYKKQYTRIQEELNLRKWFGIETGSVETFQGKEKNIIIASFVRSCTPNLGFLDEPRRLNVTLSRPKSILILIGNPKTLSLNKDFDYVIRECQRNNTFVGTNGFVRSDFKKMPPESNLRTTEISKLNQNIQALKIDQENEQHATNEWAIQKPGMDKNLDDEMHAGLPQKNHGRGRDKQKRNSRRNNRNDIANTIKDEQRNDNDKDDDIIRGYVNEQPISSRIDKRKFYSMHKLKSIGADSDDENIEKQSDKGRPTNMSDGNKSLDKRPLDLLFKELPKVPPTSGAAAKFTKEQVQQIQQQQRQYFQNLQQNRQPHYNNNFNNNFFNSPTQITSSRSQFPTCNPYFNQQHENFNFSQYPQTQRPTDNIHLPGYYNHTALSGNNLNPFAFQNNADITKAHLEHANNFTFASKEHSNESKSTKSNVSQSKTRTRKSHQNQAGAQRAFTVAPYNLASVKKEKFNKNKVNKSKLSQSEANTEDSPQVAATIQAVSANPKDSENPNKLTKPTTAVVNTSVKDMDSHNDSNSKITNSVLKSKSTSNFKPVCSSEAAKPFAEEKLTKASAYEEKMVVSASVKQVVNETPTKSFSTTKEKQNFATNNNNTTTAKKGDDKSIELSIKFPHSAASNCTADTAISAPGVKPKATAGILKATAATSHSVNIAAKETPSNTTAYTTKTFTPNRQEDKPVGSANKHPADTHPANTNATTSRTLSPFSRAGSKNYSTISNHKDKPIATANVYPVIRDYFDTLPKKTDTNTNSSFSNSSNSSSHSSNRYTGILSNNQNSDVMRPSSSTNNYNSFSTNSSNSSTYSTNRYSNIGPQSNNSSTVYGQRIIPPVYEEVPNNSFRFSNSNNRKQTKKEEKSCVIS